MGVCMKKLLLALIVGLGLVVALPVNTSAATDKLTVTGIVSSGGNPVKHVKVEVTCNGKTKHDNTNNAGYYQVKFKKSDCPNGSNVTATASKKGESGTSHGTVSGATLNINIAIGSVQAPEMGTYVSVAAVTAAGGSLLYFRRRKLAQNPSV